MMDAGKVLDAPSDATVDPDEFIRAAMEWHFNPETGSPYWLNRAKDLGFDPRAQVKTRQDLRLFPNLAAELRDIRTADLIPRGYGPRPDVVGFFESGGTTGIPKRAILMRDWLDNILAWANARYDAHGFTRGANWLGIVPTGPHVFGELFRWHAKTHGSHGFTIDMDPRWVKRLISEGRSREADAYAEHLIDQAVPVLRGQDIGVLAVTPPLLERLARREELVDLVNASVRAIRWGGTRMDPDSRNIYKTEVFPGVVFCGEYGSTMILGAAVERPGLPADAPCIFDPLAPFVTFDVVDPVSLDAVPYGQRGQVVVNHVSKSFLLPNNLERDLATRIQAPAEGTGDSVADVTPVAEFENETVIEGVY